MIKSGYCNGYGVERQEPSWRQERHEKRVNHYRTTREASKTINTMWDAKKLIILSREMRNDGLLRRVRLAELDPKYQEVRVTRCE